MKKLNQKVFITLYAVLSLFMLSVLVIFEVQNYVKEEKNVEETLRIPNDNKNDPSKKDNLPMMNRKVYSVLLGNDNQILEIMNHNIDGLTDEEIENIAKDILSKKELKENKVGNLYLEDYVYTLNNNELIFMDNENLKNNLLHSLLMKIIFFIFFEFILLFLVKELTEKITKPAYEALQKQKDFIADASHELKTPLSVIIASTEMLDKEIKDNKWLSNIQKESLGMQELVHSLLILATSEEGNLYKFENKNLSRLLELSCLTFEVKAYEKNIKLKTNIKKDIFAKIDENKMKEVIEILLDNAISHSLEETTILVNLTENNKEIILTVINEGDLISKEDEEKIFERFYRMDTSRERTKGHFGLGLAIAKNIVLSHHGKIKAYSKDKKTYFEVYLQK